MIKDLRAVMFVALLVLMALFLFALGFFVLHAAAAQNSLVTALFGAAILSSGIWGTERVISIFN